MPGFCITEENDVGEGLIKYHLLSGWIKQPLFSNIFSKSLIRRSTAETRDQEPVISALYQDCDHTRPHNVRHILVTKAFEFWQRSSGGQWRPRTYFSWYTSSFTLNDGVYDVIESINFSRSSANLQHFNIKCLTVSGSLEQSGQVDSIFYWYEMLIWYSYQFLTWGKCFVFGGSVYYGYTNHGPDFQKFLSM